LLFVDGDFRKLLDPGIYWRLPLRRTRIEVVDTLETRLAHPLLEILLADEGLRAAVEVINLTDAQRALVWRDERLAYVFGPGRYALWKQPYRLRVEVFDIAQVRLRKPELEPLANRPDIALWVNTVQVGPEEEALVFQNGTLIDRLRSGTYLYWKSTSFACRKVSLKEQAVDVAGQEIMTQDKVTLRLNLNVGYQVVDPVKAVSAVDDYAQVFYRDAQLALRAAVGARTLDALLTDKQAVGQEIIETLTGRAAEMGLAVRSAGVRDIILPGDMKQLLNEVLAAEKRAQANLIKRREETAAARNQANTARLLAENPILARLKELELLQEILAGSKPTFVFGNTNLLEQMRALAGTPVAP
jgi:regulator of protease activity HflC (stomatin/prohibitin superfamily)